MEPKHWEKANPDDEPWRCTCGHGVSFHGRRKPPGSPLWEYTGCREPGCPCRLFAASDGSRWPYGIGP